MTLAELLDHFDQKEKKGFHFSQIATAIDGLDSCEKENPRAHYEWVAFMLQPKASDEDWCGYYYGPHFSVTYDNGEKKDIPSLSEITEDAINFWESRIGAVTNPMLKMRYADLVWFLKPKVIKGAKKSGDLYRLLVDTMLIVCDEDYCVHTVDTISLLERLFLITKNNSKDLQKVKDAFIRFEGKLSNDRLVKCWSSRFILMLNNRDSFTDSETRSLVKDHEDRLQRLATPDKEGALDPWAVEEQAKLLADYYLHGNLKEDIRRVLQVSEKAFLPLLADMHPLLKMGIIEGLYHKYLHYGLVEDAKRLSVDLVRIGKDAKDSMPTHQMSFSIPKNLFQQYEVLFGKGATNDEERWTNFILHFIPQQEDEKKSLLTLLKRNPTVFKMGTKILDLKGRPMSQVGSYDNDPEGHLVLHIAQKLELSSVFINRAINEMIAAGCITKEKVMTCLIELSPIFDKQRYEFIEKAIDFYLNRDYSTFCHLVVPQIENAICTLAENCGDSILKQQRDKSGFQLKALDELLRTESVKSVFSEDIAFYLRLVLTERRALNLRNLICHGILPPDCFGAAAADRLFHVLVILGHVRYAEVSS